MRRLILMLGLVGCASPDGPGDADTDAPGSPAPATNVRTFCHGGGFEDDALLRRLVVEGDAVVTLGARDPGDAGLNAWDPVWLRLGAGSAVTVNTTSREDAEDADAVAAIDAAGLVYLRGGDQARYLEHWQGTALQEALSRAAARGAVLGGSSAGCMLLAAWAYDAREGSVAAYEALADAQDPWITFTEGFLPQLPAVVDTHFTERGRLGRLAVFVARVADQGGPSLGLGIDPNTAVVGLADGSFEIVGEGAVTLLRAGESSPTLAAPPTIRGQRMWVMPAGYTFRLDTSDPVVERPEWVGSPRPSDQLAEWEGLTIDGDDAAQRSIGETLLTGLDATGGWREGSLGRAPGEGRLPGVSVFTRLYDTRDAFEDHLGGLLWLLAARPGLVVVGVDVGNTVEAGADLSLTPGAGSVALILDGRAATHSALTPDAGWQRVALEGVSLDVVGEGSVWRAR